MYKLWARQSQELGELCSLRLGKPREAAGGGVGWCMVHRRRWQPAQPPMPMPMPTTQEEWGNTYTIRGRKPALALKEPLSHAPEPSLHQRVRDMWAQVTVLHAV